DPLDSPPGAALHRSLAGALGRRLRLSNDAKCELHKSPHLNSRTGERWHRSARDRRRLHHDAHLRHLQLQTRRHGVAGALEHHLLLRRRWLDP
ncbi:hypothetical protein PMAYCL1PPCAC_05557, partial [Pristionchus mayeri]